MIRIGNASGFYGDRASAWREMLEGGPLDVLTGDYLAELTMLILARDRLKDPSLGYARTFLRQMEQCLGLAADRGVRIVTNAGGLNPAGLAAALRSLAARLGLSTTIGYVEGDALDQPDALAANAYLGAFGIASCLDAGADVVVTGRVTDASLVVGPAIAHFGWTRDDLDALAGATVAGHVLECGAQATGGNFSFFTELPDGGRRPGFPIAEVHADGSAVITKHPGTGGAVTVETVTAQLVYEIAGPAYPGPDVVTHLDTVRLAQEGADRVRITGTRGTPPPPTLKVGVAGLDGYRNAMTFVLTGLDLDAKAALVRAQMEDAVGKEGLAFTLTKTADGALLHAAIHDPDPKRAGRAFSSAAVELALASYPGCTLTTPPTDPTPNTTFKTAEIPQLPHWSIPHDGPRVEIPPPTQTAPLIREYVDRHAARHADELPDQLRWRVGARSGDKGSDANVGVWVRSAQDFAVLRGWLSRERFVELLPELAEYPIERYEMSNLFAINFVVRGVLARRDWLDPQGKALGERLRARLRESR
ncbi:acyclic terpene utilization AtuA family protein [Phytohabitans sp. ZYX-F-186]|uniref:Acyclic terpene utilization AtuA family protein n=1 Tax=Phytohabitans maris TaxID=3071409 RepID=A0ABU0ZKI9_9ACTN|nr:acyclic terpene utilization AtuA family protein [Phytohabitans sp. ZYX-F-186]MDQ7906909.1 acyclic terpene utilization AtuA family protein [Phytohabitans sp. ZYX-F-186]